MTTEAWDVMDIDYLQSLVESMPSRIEAVIQARGGMKILIMIDK